MTHQSENVQAGTDTVEVKTSELSALTTLLATKFKKDSRNGYLKLGIIAALGVGYLGIVGSATGMFASKPESYLAVVPMTGEIGEGKDLSSDVMNPVLKKAFDDEKAKAVVLYINSPGGSPVHSSLIYKQVMRLKAQTKKPVYAVGKDLVASGGYYIASSADKIFVDKSTIIGSIGVISGGFGFTGAMEKLGIERRVITAGESKNLLDPFSPTTPKSVAMLQQMTAEIHTNFKEAVMAGRGARLKVADNPDVFSGRIWTGSASLKVGIADGIGDLETVKTAVGAKEAVVFKAEDSPFKSILSKFGMKFGASVAEGAVSQLSSDVQGLN